MKKNIISIGIFGLIFTSLLLAVSAISFYNPLSVYAYSTGSPGTKTGSPLDMETCNSIGCHSGGLGGFQAVNFSITSAALAGGYVPGQTYTITTNISGTASSKIGFETTVESDFPAAKTGTIIITDAVRTQSINLGSAITHTINGTSAASGATSWSFDWIAPIAGTGDVTFYGAINASNNDGTISGDDIYNMSFPVFEKIISGVDNINLLSEVSIYPNPATNFITLLSTSKIDNITIYSITGKQILFQKTPSKKIDITKLESGIYFVIVVNNKSQIKYKLIKK